MNKKSIKHISLVRLSKFFLLAIAVIIAIIALSYRSFFTLLIENRVNTTAEVIKAGLTSYMKMGMMDKRAYYLNEISQMYDMKAIEIIRSQSVNRQFGPSKMSFERYADAEIKALLDQKESHYEWKESIGEIKVIVPYIASAKGTLNCLECHNVQEGDVLGGVSLTMDISSYQSFVYRYSYFIATALILFSLIIIFDMSQVIERYIKRPLLGIINDGHLAYELKEPIQSTKYNSKEFILVAENINTFNQKIIAKEKELRAKNEQLEALNNEIELTLQETMFMIGKIEEIRSDETKLHTMRVTKLSAKMAEAYGLSKDKVKLIEMGSALHDIGKIGIPDRILNKPGKLTTEEFELMKQHVSLGSDILNHSERELLKIAALIAHEHHEKWDGSGYPKGLKGEEISIYGRIVAIVDVMDALLSKRIYKEAWPSSKVKDYLIEQKGKHFDPDIIDIVILDFDQYVEIVKRYTNTH